MGKNYWKKEVANVLNSLLLTRIWLLHISYTSFIYNKPAIKDWGKQEQHVTFEQAWKHLSKSHSSLQLSTCVDCIIKHSSITEDSQHADITEDQNTFLASFLTVSLQTLKNQELFLPHTTTSRQAHTHCSAWFSLAAEGHRDSSIKPTKSAFQTFFYIQPQF